MRKAFLGLLIIAGLVGGYSIYEGIVFPTEFGGVSPSGEYRGPLLSGRGWRMAPGTCFDWETKSCLGKFIPDRVTMSAVCKGQVLTLRGEGVVGLKGEMNAPAIPGLSKFDGKVSPEW